MSSAPSVDDFNNEDGMADPTQVRIRQLLNDFRYQQGEGKCSLQAMTDLILFAVGEGWSRAWPEVEEDYEEGWVVTGPLGQPIITHAPPPEARDEEGHVDTEGHTHYRRFITMFGPWQEGDCDAARRVAIDALKAQMAAEDAGQQG